MTRAELTEIRAHAATTQRANALAASFADRLLHEIAHPTARRDEILKTGLERIQREAKQGDDAGAAILARLHAEGIEAPNVAQGDELRLDQLDTPDVRELHRLIERANDLANRIDAERGRAADFGPVLGVRGTDLGEQTGQLLSRLSLDLFGPSERVTGGRE